MKTVLLVDDETLALHELREGLEDHGIICVLATNLNVAITVLRQQSEIVAIVTDFRMPRGNGLDLLWQARERELLRGKKIIMVSGFLDDAVAAKVESLGLDIATFPKPLDIEEIAAAIMVPDGQQLGPDVGRASSE